MRLFVGLSVSDCDLNITVMMMMILMLLGGGGGGVAVCGACVCDAYDDDHWQRMKIEWK